MRLRTSRRRRTKSPCTVTVASEHYSVQTSKRTKNVFSFLVQCHTVFCNSYIGGSFIGLYTLYNGNEKQGEPKRDPSRMQRTFDGRLFQTTTPAPVTEAFMSGSLVRAR